MVDARTNSEKGPAGSPDISYKFDEICIVARGGGGPAAARYDAVRNLINDGLRTLISQLGSTLIPDAVITQFRADSPSPRVEALIQDLQRGPEWDNLANDIRAGADALRVIDPLPDLRNDALWVDLAVNQDAARPDPVILCFYQIGTKRRFPEDHATYAARHRLVRDLTLAINLNKGFFRSDFKNISAAPNWFCAAAQAVCHSPAAPPLDDPASINIGQWTFQFPAGSPAGSVASTGRANGSSTVVAILDTSPVEVDEEGTITKTTKARVHDLAEAFPNNRLLASVDAHVNFDDVNVPPPGAFEDLFDYLWPQVQNHVPEYGNHGLFISGIIHDLAPNAETHLYRAMHDGGLSDVRHFTSLMNELPTMFPNKNLVVNMSVDFTVPPGIEILGKNLPTLYDVLVALGADTLAGANEALTEVGLKAILFWIEDVTANVDQTVDSLASNDNILVVGAAGNDNGAPYHAQPSGARPDPRYPANNPKVLSVAATRGDNMPTRYSNQADVSLPLNGIATLGGDTVVAADGDPEVDPGDLVHGIGAMPGTATCWIDWAGTSFATPVITALAADYWDANPGLTGHQVLAAVIGLEDTGQIAVLDCPAIRASQIFV